MSARGTGRVYEEMPERMKRTVVMETEGFMFPVVHTVNSLWLPPAAIVDAVPLVLDANREERVARREWPVQTKFWYMGSRKTSALYKCQDYRAFEPLRYVGMAEDWDKRYACFVTESLPEGYFAWAHIGSELCWGLPNCSVRVISMDRVLCERPDGVCDWLPLRLLSKEGDAAQRKLKRRAASEMRATRLKGGTK